MPGWNIFNWIFFFLLVLFIGIPMWLIGKIRGEQPDNRFTRWLEAKLEA